jgi:hypothetical protein
MDDIAHPKASMSEDGSDNSDEWGTADLPDLPVNLTTAKTDETENTINDHDDDGWTTQLPVPPQQQSTSAVEEDEKVSAGEPMIIVDMTMLSQKQELPEIHSRFDRNSVNDADAVKHLRRTIEAEYSAYARHAEYLSERIVIPCGSTVWKEALPRLRDERPGHYFCPVFPPRRANTNG